MKVFKNTKAYENAHILLWLLKDTGWCHGWHWLGMSMILPTLLVQIHITWASRRDTHDVFHNLAVACWITANAIWMSGEFYRNDGWRPQAQWLFGIGCALMLFYYVFHFRNHGTEVLTESIQEGETC